MRRGDAAKLVVAMTWLGCSTAPGPEAYATSGSGPGNARQTATPQIGAVSGAVDAGGPCAQDFGSCPASLPEAGAPCVADPALLCEYGADPLVLCNAVASCKLDGGWVVSMPPDGGDSGCPTVLPSRCPPTFAAGEDASVECSPTDLLSCTYPDGMCSCEPGEYATVDGGPVYEWMCSGPPSGGCPSTHPRLGTACTEGEACSYTTYCDPLASSCTCGTWRQTLCPAIQGAIGTLL